MKGTKSRVVFSGNCQGTLSGLEHTLIIFNVRYPERKSSYFKMCFQLLAVIYYLTDKHVVMQVINVTSGDSKIKYS